MLQTTAVIFFFFFFVADESGDESRNMYLRVSSSTPWDVREALAPAVVFVD